MQFKEWLSLDEVRFKGFKRMFDKEHPDMPKYVRNDLYQTRVGHMMNRQLNPTTPPGTGSPTNGKTNPTMSPSQIMDRAGFRQDKWSAPQILKNKWGKEGVTPADFDEKTQWYFLDRRFGFREETQIRNDKQRTDIQRQIGAYKMPGTNEPVIVRQNKKGYELLEGWHRTMSLLVKGCPQDQLKLLQNNEGYVQDFDLSRWSPVLIKAYVANGDTSGHMDGTAAYTPARSIDDPDGTGEYIPTLSHPSNHPPPSPGSNAA